MRCQVARPVRAARGKRIGNNPDTAPRSDPYIIGTDRSAIGTLVERQTGDAMLLHLPDGYKPEQVRDALAVKIKTLPESLRLSLTWDQGPEMRDWKKVSVDADIYFCDPHSPWQRGTNENFNAPAAPILSEGHQPERAQQ